MEQPGHDEGREQMRHRHGGGDMPAGLRHLAGRCRVREMRRIRRVRGGAGARSVRAAAVPGVRRTGGDGEVEHRVQQCLGGEGGRHHDGQGAPPARQRPHRGALRGGHRHHRRPGHRPVQHGVVPGHREHT
ncbi:hypothetical protein [Streptomyces zingiberis]|uniref:Uncharacterized protein n=1 Tax=Streptomyces zingiberis TaxID=2053010 RepID=A0ABX1C0N7_9ACTN|nr:hypothetical protein [Streptomyces zingiberis]NJQ03479.1 hypothetical protein [Streptomyces zingiberis]